jgi:putative Holliday junction resolvase
MGRIAAIDYGLKRIGIALSDPSRKVALPLATVEGGKKAIQNIAKTLPLKDVELILIGLPLLMSGQKGEMAEAVQKFARLLEDALSIPVLLCDERLSSKGAEASLKELSLSRKQRTEKLDMVAATLLLQSYLDQKK